MHAIVLTRETYFSTPYIYLAVCVCGGWFSGKRGTDLDAWKSGQQHVAAKGGPDGTSQVD